MSYSNENPFYMPVQPAYGNSGGGMFGGGWGNDWMWIIVLFLFGWNNNGWGGGMFGGGNMNGGVGSEVQRGFDHSSVIMKLDGLTTGLADLGFALTNTMTNGFHGVDSAICNLGYQTQAGFNALAAQMAKCCCDTREAISGVRYDLATQACDTRNAIANSTRDIIENQNANGRAILDALNQNYTRSLESKVNDMTIAAYFAELKAYNRATAEANTAEILRRSGHECPTAAYIVQPPTPVNFPVNSCGQVFFGNNGCGYNTCGYAA